MLERVPEDSDHEREFMDQLFNAIVDRCATVITMKRCHLNDTGDDYTSHTLDCKYNAGSMHCMDCKNWR